MSKLAVMVNGERFVVELTGPPAKDSSCFELTIDGKQVKVQVPAWRESIENWHWFEVEGRSYEVDLDSELHWIKSPCGLHRLDVHDLDASVPVRPKSRDPRIKAPIPGMVAAVFVKEGDPVQAGAPVLILEAMKMENEIAAPVTGTISKLNARVGKSANLGEVLAEIKEA